MMQHPGLRQSLTIWLAIYPLLTIILWGIGDALSELPLAARTFVLTLGIVPLMVFVCIPITKQIVDRLFPMKS